MSKLAIETRLKKMEQHRRTPDTPKAMITTEEIRDGPAQYTTLQEAQQAWEEMHPGIRVIHINMMDPRKDAGEIAGYGVVE